MLRFYKKGNVWVLKESAWERSVADMALLPGIPYCEVLWISMAIITNPAARLARPYAKSDAVKSQYIAVYLNSQVHCTLGISRANTAIGPSTAEIMENTEVCSWMTTN